MNETVENQNVKTINIFPCKNSRRVLTFLADFFICFIAAIFLFEMLIKPISFASIKYNELALKTNTAAVNNMKILYGNNLLYYNEITEGNITDSIKLTCDKYTEEFCLNKEDKSYDVFTHYIVDIKGQDDSILLEKFEKEASKYFDIDEAKKSIKMKQEYIDFFSPKFEEKNEMSEIGAKKYSTYQEEFFLKFYAEIILQDVIKNDLALEGKPELGSYISNYNENIDFDNKIATVMKIDASIAFVLTMMIFYFIVPLTNRKGRTCAEMIMKIEHVDIRSVKYLKKRFVATEGIMNTLTNSVMLFFIPFVSYGVGPVFALTELISISIIGLVLVLIQLVLLLATKMNQTLKEFSTHSICVDTSTMDEYYKEKGYDF